MGVHPTVELIGPGGRIVVRETEAEEYLKREEYRLASAPAPVVEEEEEYEAEEE